MRRGLFYGQTAFFDPVGSRESTFFVETAFFQSGRQRKQHFLSGETEIFSGVQYRCAR
jgi:hypothetical protein